MDAVCMMNLSDCLFMCVCDSLKAGPANFAEPKAADCFVCNANSRSHRTAPTPKDSSHNPGFSK